MLQRPMRHRREPMGDQGAPRHLPCTGNAQLKMKLPLMKRIDTDGGGFEGSPRLESRHGGFAPRTNSRRNVEDPGMYPGPLSTTKEETRNRRRPASLISGCCSFCNSQCVQLVPPCGKTCNDNRLTLQV
ncbi:uncharacterized protein LOC143315666 [Chaetodon auriga]|uniref:uncharacterized protein LOC143315666 n=1 Tax=Chaetodon auriga TaxID=39042 RepID=UPI004032EA20